jgi:hypothetical protein
VTITIDRDDDTTALEVFERPGEVLALQISGEPGWPKVEGRRGHGAPAVRDDGDRRVVAVAWP